MLSQLPSNLLFARPNIEFILQVNRMISIVTFLFMGLIDHPVSIHCKQTQPHFQRYSKWGKYDNTLNSLYLSHKYLSNTSATHTPTDPVNCLKSLHILWNPPLNHLRIKVCFFSYACFSWDWHYTSDPLISTFRKFWIIQRAFDILGLVYNRRLLVCFIIQSHFTSVCNLACDWIASGWKMESFKGNWNLITFHRHVIWETMLVTWENRMEWKLMHNWCFLVNGGV